MKYFATQSIKHLLHLWLTNLLYLMLVKFLKKFNNFVFLWAIHIPNLFLKDIAHYR